MHEEDDYDDGFDDEDEEDFDCHADFTTGYCGAAGSEDCEFECPYRSQVDAIRARHAKRYG